MISTLSILLGSLAFGALAASVMALPTIKHNLDSSTTEMTTLANRPIVRTWEQASILRDQTKPGARESHIKQGVDLPPPETIDEQHGHLGRHSKRSSPSRTRYSDEEFKRTWSSIEHDWYLSRYRDLLGDWRRDNPGVEELLDEDIREFEREAMRWMRMVIRIDEVTSGDGL